VPKVAFFCFFFFFFFLKNLDRSKTIFFLRLVPIPRSAQPIGLAGNSAGDGIIGPTAFFRPARLEKTIFFFFFFLFVPNEKNLFPLSLSQRLPSTSLSALRTSSRTCAQDGIAARTAERHFVHSRIREKGGARICSPTPVSQNVQFPTRRVIRAPRRHLNGHKAVREVFPPSTGLMPGNLHY